MGWGFFEVVVCLSVGVLEFWLGFSFIWRFLLGVFCEFFGFGWFFVGFFWGGGYQKNSKEGYMDRDYRHTFHGNLASALIVYNDFISTSSIINIYTCNED